MCFFKRIFIFVTFAFFLFSCQNEEETVAGEVATFFDIEEKIREDIKVLESQNYQLLKSVSFEGKNDETLLVNPDWETEFETFEQLNINKSQWADKYSADTVISGERKTITYQAVSSSMPVKRMVITFQNEKVVDIFISYGRRNILFVSKNEIRYVPFTSYTIKGSQKALFLSSHAYEVLGKLIQNNE
jgi:hypothetical protein